MTEVGNGLMLVEVSTAVYGYHRWPEAPPHRKYLSYNHPHLFRITIWARVTQTDREIEFHDLKGDLHDISSSIITANQESCEEYCYLILREMLRLYPFKIVKIRVAEDEDDAAVLEI
jgi:hypothetical protein